MKINIELIQNLLPGGNAEHETLRILLARYEKNNPGACKHLLGGILKSEKYFFFLRLLGILGFISTLACVISAPSLNEFDSFFLWGFVSVLLIIVSISQYKEYPTSSNSKVYQFFEDISFIENQLHRHPKVFLKDIQFLKDVVEYDLRKSGEILADFQKTFKKDPCNQGIGNHINVWQNKFKDLYNAARRLQIISGDKSGYFPPFEKKDELVGMEKD